jgi:uncharacterized protein (PEP-CTERM system associated)
MPLPQPRIALLLAPNRSGSKLASARTLLLAGAVSIPLLVALPARAQLFDPGDPGDSGVSAPTVGAAPAAPSGPPALSAPTDTLQPRTGVDATDSDLRGHLMSAFGSASGSATGNVPQTGLAIYKQIGVSETYSTNAGYNLGAGSGSGNDFITSIQPAIRVVDTTQRVKIDLTYDPVAQIYARNSSYTQFEEQANGDILVTLLPDWLYLDMRGMISQQSIFGGVGPATTVTLSPDERETVSSVSISPYMSHTFGGNGTVEAGVGYSYSAVDASNALNRSIIDGSFYNGLGDYGSSYLNTERGFASYTTGENLGRFRNRIGTDDSYYQGSGALSNAHRDLTVDDVSYAFTRAITGLGELGYEWLNYPAAGFRYNGIVGAAGVELRPGRKTDIIVEYRYLDGFGSLYVQGEWQATPRIRVFGGYSEGISTFQQDLQTSLLDETTDVTGFAASSLNASPLLQSSNFFGANEYLSRVRRLDATATYLGTRDTATLSFEHEHTSPVGHPIGTLLPLSTSGYFVSASDRHEITPTLSASAFVQYGHNSTGLADLGSGDTVSFSVSLDKVFTQTLTGYVRVGGTYIVGGSAYAATGYRGLSGDETDFTVGAVKRF